MQTPIHEYIAPKIEATLSDPLGGEFPPDVYILQHKRDKNVHAMYTDHKTINGLATFVTERGAHLYLEHLNLPNFETKEMSFDDARDLAQKKSEHFHKINCLVLCDNVKDIKVHYIK